MKKLVTFTMIALFAVSLVACAQSGGKQVKVKCPACGYEFLAPVGD